MAEAAARLEEGEPDMGDDAGPAELDLGSASTASSDAAGERAASRVAPASGGKEEPPAASLSAVVASADERPAPASSARGPGSEADERPARVGPEDASLSRSSSASIAAGDSALMEIVGPGLIKLAAKFKPDGEEDNAKNAAANFIQKLNGYVIKLGEKEAVAGGSRRALKRIMKKYSRRVGRSRRQRGKRVKPSAQ